MLFNSFEFLLFFLLSLATYAVTPKKFRWLQLLIFSYGFYMWWNPKYILLIVVSTLIDYWCSMQMGKLPKVKRKPFLWLSILSNLGILFAFKYFNFFADAAQNISTFLNISYSKPFFEVMLPMGISFYTFQTMSFSIDVYNDKIKPEKHLGIFALYVSYFPQLVAGPIERASHLLPQIKNFHAIQWSNISIGFRWIILGLIKKVVIADRLALYTDSVYNNPSNFGALTLVLATIFFAFQIYCDFSGYSDIAVGVARFFNVKLMENFKMPYFSTSISEFWKRWHISLSTWFRDYVYIPLGGNRTVKWKWYYNLFITFLISGLWHGANWTFVIWGALHGMFLILAIIFNQKGENANNSTFKYLLKNIWVFTLVLMGWVFFRSNTVIDAFYILKTIATTNWSISQIFVPISSNNVYNLDLMLSCFWILGLLFFEGAYFFNWNMFKIAHKPIMISIGVILIFIFGVFESKQFIYFQF